MCGQCAKNFTRFQTLKAHMSDIHHARYTVVPNPGQRIGYPVYMERLL